MSTKIFRIKASFNFPIDLSWQEQLADLLGNKPRRLSLWSELGLFGALSCLKRVDQQQLSSSVTIRVFTILSTVVATNKAIEQENEVSLMPFTFLQTQPSQLFNAIGTALGWNGDGVVTSYDPPRFGEAGLLRSIEESAMLGWVDEQPELISRWILLEKVNFNMESNWQEISSVFQTSADARWLKLDESQQILNAS